MFIFKRKPPLPEYNMEEFKNFAGKTIEAMLLTKEETIHISEKYNLFLIFSWEGDYIEGIGTQHISHSLLINSFTHEFIGN